MFRKLILAFSLLLGSLSAWATDLPRQTDDWLTGTWVLCEDPDGSPKDSLQFNPDGTGLVIRAKGNIEFSHRRAGLAVSILANANGKAIPIELSAAPSHDKLLAHSEKTGNTAIYVRSESKDAAACSIK